MHKLNLKIATAALLTAVCFGSAFAAEQAPTVSASTNVLRGTTDMVSQATLSVRSKMSAMTDTNSVSRSTASSSTHEDSNTTGMLLAGLAIMGLVVRRRMNQS